MKLFKIRISSMNNKGEDFYVHADGVKMAVHLALENYTAPVKEISNIAVDEICNVSEVIQQN